jgi:hypothetical protein
MRRYYAAVLIVLFWCAVPGLSIVFAQQVSSFQQLQLIVKPGDKIDVIGVDGIRTRGKIESLTPASLRLSTKGGFRDFAQKDALEIKQKRSDSLANGALIGAVTGGGIMSAAAIALCSGGECYGEGRQVAGAIVEYTGIGAAIGVGIDAIFKHHQTIYKQPAQNALRNIDVAPLLTSGRKGAAVRFSF